jgi:hypothetical protein
VFLAAGFSRSELPHELQTRAVSSGVDFVSNNELRGVLGATAATPAQVNQAVAINEDARLRALLASFLIVGAISLLAIFPASRLPKNVPGELSADDIVNEAAGSPAG